MSSCKLNQAYNEGNDCNIADINDHFVTHTSKFV